MAEPIAIDSSDDEGPQVIDDDDSFEEVRAVIKKKPRLAASSSKSGTPPQGARQNPGKSTPRADYSSSSSLKQQQQQQQKPGPLARESIAAKVALETYRAMQARRAQERQGQGGVAIRTRPQAVSAHREAEAETDLSSAPLTSWTCQTCTLCNAASEQLCVACASPRPGLRL